MNKPAGEGPIVKGWCPGALRPMLSGDGWVVRIRPPLGRLTQAQATGIADLAQAHGSGLLDLSNRANVQVRGVTPEGHRPLIDGLRALGLVDANALIEGRRNVMVTPFADAATYDLARALTDRLAQDDAPELSGKFGFAIDTGGRPVLQDAPADVRLERAAFGELILCADGAPHGMRVSKEDAIDAMIALARTALQAGSAPHFRMGKLIASGWALPPLFNVPRSMAPVTGPILGPVPGPVAHGFLTGFAFGQLEGDTLRALGRLGALRVTPWRMLLIEGRQTAPDIAGLITDANDPLRRVVACTGAPGCSQALAATRALARDLAPRIAPRQTLHVSGCAKGCAHPRNADITLTATAKGFDLARNARAGDTPQQRGLTATQLSKAI